MKTKNKIIVISIIALTFVIVFSLGFAFIKNLASFGTIFDDYLPNISVTDSDVDSGLESTEHTIESTEDSTKVPVMKEYVSINLEIYTLEFIEDAITTNLYTTIKRSYELGSEYSLDIPDYSSQGFYCMNDYKINGVAEKDQTIKLVYTDAELNSIYASASQVDPNSFNIKIDKYVYRVFSPGEFFVLTNNSNDVFVNPTVDFYSLEGDKLESNYVCHFTLEGYSVQPGESIILFPSYMSYDSGKINSKEGFKVLGVKGNNAFYTYDFCEEFKIAMDNFMK